MKEALMAVDRHRKIDDNRELSSRLREAVSRVMKRMGLEIAEPGLDDMVAYAEELQRWNRAYNLVGRRTGVSGMVDLYVDSLTPLCIKGLIDEEKELLDVGSGAGLPGIPLYIAAGPFKLTLVESQRKKISFLRHIKRRLELRDIGLYPARLEEMAKEEDRLNAYDVGLARAVMDPLLLAGGIYPLISEGGVMVLFVGREDAGRMRRKGPDFEKRGMKIEALRSVQRFTGKDNYLAVITKSSKGIRG